MRNILTVAIHFILAGNSIAQQNKIVSQLKVIKLEKFDCCYLIQGYDEKKLDTLSFISLIDTACNSSSLEVICLQKSYIFEIVDMDVINGLPAHSIPYPYFMSFGETNIIRNGRNGRTIETTQYRSTNTKGLLIDSKYSIRH